MLRKNCALAVLCIEAMIVGITDGLAADQNTAVPYPNVHASTNSSVIARGGRLASWSEDDLVARFRAGLLLEESRMPWIAYQGMHEDDVRSIYRYLKSLPAAHTPDADND